MARKNFCDDGLLREAEEIVVNIVSYFRSRGYRCSVAVDLASERLDLSRRRTWSLNYQQPVAMARSELRRLKRRWIAHLWLEQEELLRQSAEMRTRRLVAEADLQQELDI